MCVTSSKSNSSLDPSLRPCTLVLVKAFSLILALVTTVLACTHLHYLLHAFSRKRALIAEVRAGRDLNGEGSFLWCVLYSFGEADDDTEVSERKDKCIAFMRVLPLIAEVRAGQDPQGEDSFL